MTYDDEKNEDMNDGFDGWNYGVPVNTYEDMYEETEEDDRDAQYYDDLTGEIIERIENDVERMEDYVGNDFDESSF